MELLFVLGRIFFGGFFVISGIRHFQHLQMMASFTGQKGMPAPKLAVIVSGLLILLGGLSTTTASSRTASCTSCGHQSSWR